MLVRLAYIFQRRNSGISRLEKEIRGINREIEHLEEELREFQKSSLPERGKPILPPRRGRLPADFEARRRFASYLSTGSFQTIREYKFKSDFVRKRRLLWGSAIIALAAIVILLLKLL